MTREPEPQQKLSEVDLDSKPKNSPVVKYAVLFGSLILLCGLVAAFLHAMDSL